MAGVLDALASYVTGMLTEMAKEEVAMLIGVSGEIDKLGVKLSDLKNFLVDADRRNITDTSVQVWVEELKRAMYDVTDILDLCRFKVMEEGPSKDMGCFNPLLFCMRNPLHAHDIGTRIKTLNQKLDDISKRAGNFNFIKLDAYQDRTTTRSLATDRKTDSLIERSGAVGEKIEEDTRALVEVLTRDEADGKGDSLMVVGIVGVGGIGKTILGKKVFNDEAIEAKFTKKIWLSITQNFSDVELLSTAITSAGGDLPGEGAARDKTLLVVALRNAIRDKKFLLVLDDMWGVDEWEKLLMIPFSYGGPGSRVLITTRHQTVGRSMKVVHYHHVHKLSPEDAWSLLKKQCMHYELDDCEGFVKLPDSIVQLRELSYLGIDGTHVNSIPRGFGALTNLKVLLGFPAYMDGDWCSLEELGPLSQVKEIGLMGLENVSATPSIAKARVGGKTCLTKLALKCNSRVGNDGFLKGGVSKEDAQRIEEVFDELCPLPCLEYLKIDGYFGRHLPRWMMRTTTVPLENLRTLWMSNLACCTQLPDGLCRLSCLEFFHLIRAPAIKRVGPEFVQPYNHGRHLSSQTVAAFPKLHMLILIKMVEWEEWEWEKEVQAMPALEDLCIGTCKLRCIPPGLSFHARSLKKLHMFGVKGLHSLENFASVVELKMQANVDLTKISNFPKLQKLEIDLCPKLVLLQEMTALRTLRLQIFKNWKRLPLYLQTVNPSHLLLDCGTEAIASIAAGKSGSEFYKLSHIKRVEAYAKDGDVEKKWYVHYTREPYIMETNIVRAESSGDGDEKDVDNKQAKNEEEDYQIKEMIEGIMFPVALLFTASG